MTILTFSIGLLSSLLGENWRIDELSFNLHESELSDEYKILTSYEQRWLGEGRMTQFVSAVNRPISRHVNSTV